MNNRFEAAAVTYAEHGYAVFPCKPRGKEPLTKNGLHDATREERTILQWWDRWPDANIGLACGASGFAALDIDSKAGADPREVLAAMGLSDFAVVWTGEAPERSAKHPSSLEGVRGAHVVFRSDLPTMKTTVPGVEIRGVGGYIVAPPSVHPSGVPYEGDLPPVAELPDAPAGLHFIARPEPSSAPAPDDLAEIPEGGRHEALLAWARSRYTAKGVLGQPALDGMRGYNQRALKPSLEDSEVVRLFKHLERTRIAESERERADVAKPPREVEVVNLAGIVPTRARFLWNPYLPLGKVVIVAGAPGHGKSQLSALMAAMATRGQLDGDLFGKPSRVLMLCAEDDLSDTVVPRLLAVNADLRLIDTINTRITYQDGLTANGLIMLPSDVPAIHAWAKTHENAGLIILDPVASFFDREHNTLFNQDVRDALGPLVAIAAIYGITIVVILHLNKSESKDFQSRVAESHGFQALARSVLALGPDPDDPQRERGSQKVLAVTKANLIKPGMHSLRCEVRSVTLPGFAEPIETSELVLLGKCEVSADDLLMGAAEHTTRMEAAAWLADFIDGGWRKVGDVRKAATSDGYSWRTIERVRISKGYQREKESGTQHGVWWIGAPGAEPRARADVPPASGGLAALGQDRGGAGVDGDGGVGGNDPSNTATPPEAGGESRGRAREGFDLDEYRRWQDRMLGEREDDDDA